MKRIVLTTAIALGLAAPAFANDQLARSLGVEPGVYSTAELAKIKNASELTGNDARVFIGDSLGFAATDNAGAVQLANSLGVAPGDYSVAELAILKQAAEKTDNESRVFFGDSLGFAATSNPGADQIAASLGVEPGKYTVAQLAILKQAAEKTDNEGRVFFD